jgi:hypothetical protein
MGCQSDQRDGGGEVESDQRDCRGLSCVVIHIGLCNSIICGSGGHQCHTVLCFIDKKTGLISLERSGPRQPMCAARQQRGFRFRLARAGSAAALPFAPCQTPPPAHWRRKPESAPLVKRPEKRSSCSRRTGASAEREGDFDPQSKAELAQGEYKGAREALARHVRTTHRPAPRRGVARGGC